ncbi:carbohydrate kinase family protein [Rahnella woolbedingensis]|uniref:Carbohydrate kinase n=1 Tax=Rahnella woolbedingensis TaxID=1510574 RepID=A0A419N7Y9_9GAMM|nr:carbohydrate kinase [Rahnella woolbedingensis]RJT43412.1 carbohydrate kinase [Rahnella woolbedingensis]
MRRPKIACIGELLIDFVCTDIGVGLKDGTNFLKKAGGAPANVATAINRSGGQAKLAAKVGDDPFGNFLIQTLATQGIELSGLRRSATSTTLAFVALQSDGERDFSFHRGADGELAWQDIPSDFLDDTGIVHFGAATGLLDGELYVTCQRLLREARQRNLLISFDPNYRDGLWGHNPQEFITRCKPWFREADIVKVSEEELYFISNTKSKEAGCRWLHDAGVSYVTVTCGNQGTWVSHKAGMQQLVPSICVDCVDSTGAGDAFIGALLQQLVRQDCGLDDQQQFLHAVRWANICGALTCTRFGAIDAIPTAAEVDVYLKNNQA